MKTSFVKDLAKRGSSDVLIYFFAEKKEPLFDKKHLTSEINQALKAGDFKGEKGQMITVYPAKGKELRALLVGVGSKAKLTKEALRRQVAAATLLCMKGSLKKISVLFPELKGDFFEAIFEGISLTSYTYLDFVSEKKLTSIESLQIVGIEKPKDLKRLETILSGVNYVRDLVNGNADTITPSYLVSQAKAMEKQFSKVKATIFDRKRLEKEKMGLILAVSRASPEEPYLIQLSYRGNPSSKEHVVLVGKGVTYDTGGYSLKPTNAMLDMKCDMAGSATVLGALKTAADLNLKVNVTALVPTAENCIGSKSYKLGDVYRSYSGKTVEIDNTDAEGRLLLADALSYACKQLKPTCIVDLATLTGAIIIALGEEMAGFFSENVRMEKALKLASEETDEALWHLPLLKEYQQAFRSEHADMKNSGGREAGSMKAALFLREFVDPKVPWAHIDIAGVAYWDKPRYYNVSKATGYGVRLLTAFLENEEMRKF